MLTTVEPQLFVADVTASCEFYVSRLGFTGVFAYGEPPFYGQVQRDSAELRQQFLDFQSADVDFHQTLRHEPWGARTFVVRDPDGNLVLFGAPAD